MLLLAQDTIPQKAWKDGIGDENALPEQRICLPVFFLEFPTTAQAPFAPTDWIKFRKTFLK